MDRPSVATPKHHAKINSRIVCGNSTENNCRNSLQNNSLTNNILLCVDESEGRTRMKDVAVARMLGTTPQTICQVKKDYLQKTQVPDSIKRKKRETPPVAAKIDGNVEAHIIAIACSNPPAGYGRWTLRLIADRMVELDYIDAISHTAVGKTLKKTGLSLT